MSVPKEQLPSDIPSEAVSFLTEIGYFEPDSIKVGDSAPVLFLTPLTGAEAVQIPAVNSERPTVLIFGSYT